MRLYNTLSRRKEEFRPLEPGRVSIYSCGPTVYRYAHIGNLRTYIFADLLCRVLEYLGHDVTQVMNITDVGHLTDDRLDQGDDKVLASARREGKTAEEIARFYAAAFLDDAALLNIRRAARYPYVTEHIPQIIELTARLIERGHAYESGGSVFFDIASFPAYGQLSGNSPDALRMGARGEPDPRKRSPGDFALWREGKRRVQAWDSPWGRGFPGWHIECSAISTSLLGDRFDIHTSGVDLVFPHNEAEIAQGEAAFGHQVVGCWLHGEHLLISGAKMAKSTGNPVRSVELADAGYDPLAFRYVALQAKYRSKLNFATDLLAGADRALRQLRERIAQWQGAPDGPRHDYEERFRAAISDDLDVPSAMALVSEVVRSDLAPGARAGLLLEWDRVLGLDLGAGARRDGGELPAGAAELLEQRARAREARDYATSDRLRDQLAELGVAVTDSRDGQSWRRTQS
jgi:cysteinyl-tRNA synthetase